MVQWIAVPKCPHCETPMHPEEDYDYWTCPDCWFSGSQYDLALTDDENEDEE